MAVRAKDTEVLDSVVGRVPVDVMELEGNGLAAPLSETAALAPSSLISRCNQTALERAALIRRVKGQHILQRTRWNHRARRALAPALAQEMLRVETQLADSASQDAVVGSSGRKPKSTQRVRDGDGFRYRLSHFVIGPLVGTTQELPSATRACDAALSWGK